MESTKSPAAPRASRRRRARHAWLFVPAGSYRARAVGYQFGVADTGAEQVVLTFEILDEGLSRGERVTWLGSFTGAAAEPTRRALRTCGWRGRDVADPTGIDANEVTLVVVHEPRHGRRVARVKWINRVGGGRVALRPAMDAERKAALAARLGALAASATQGHGTIAGAP